MHDPRHDARDDRETCREHRPHEGKRLPPACGEDLRRLVPVRVRPEPGSGGPLDESPDDLGALCDRLLAKWNLVKVIGDAPDETVSAFAA